jgi:signal transduction histidine kinase
VLDTKSRNIRYTAWIKLLAALLCLAGPLAAAWGMLQVYNFRYVPYGDDYLKSGDFVNDITQSYQRVYQAAFGEDRSTNELSGLPGGIAYWARRADGSVLTNIPQGSDPDEYFAKLEGRLVAPPGPGEGYSYLYDGMNNPYYYNTPPEGASLYVAMSQELLDRNAARFHADRALGIQGAYWLGAGLLAFLLGMAWLVYAAGRRPDAEGVRLTGLDFVYLDIGFVAAAVVVAFCSLGLFFFYDKVFHAPSINRDVAYVMIALLAECLTATLTLWLTSAARRLKRREFVKHTLVYTVLAWIFRMPKQALGAGVLAVKAVLLFAAYAAASCLMFLAFALLVQTGYQPFAAFLAFMVFAAVNVVAVVYILRKVAALRGLISGVQTIRAGNLAHRIPAAGGAPFTELAASVNGIAEGLSAAVGNEVKAERMKAELITNVSHDLKTPLTSIITYIDLLKSEGPGSEHAAEYVGVLDAKARRLKALTEDLFEAAKAASGSMQPSLEKLDVGELIEQGLGELSDRIRESGLDFRFAKPERRLFVMADGKLLWRVMENLFSNVFKYAMPSSRVYVAASGAGGRVTVAVKNISAAELNMPAEALMERFTRGDASRHSEGSGLGLAIAKSLTELQGGRFFLEIDGDLFKAGVEFPEAV